MPPRLNHVLPVPLRVAFWNEKSLKDEIVRSKQKILNKSAPGNYKCGKKLCQICNIISLENEFTNRHKSIYIRSILILIATVNAQYI